MAYDKETRTINIGENETQKDFEKDMAAYWTHVGEGIQKELKARNSNTPVKPSSPGLMERLNSLPRAARAALAGFAFWTLWVFIRTADDYEILGADFDQWDDDAFFVNWLGLPFVVGLLFVTYRWVMKEKSGQTKSAPPVNPLDEFEKEVATWPADQARAAFTIIKATLQNDYATIEKTYGDLTLEQFRKVKEVVEKMQS